MKQEITILFPDSNWSLRITKLGNKRYGYSLYWGDKTIPTHYAETFKEELEQFVIKSLDR